MKNYLFHRFVFVLLRYTAVPFIKRAMRYSCEKRKGPDVPSIIIANHNIDLDPGLVAMAFSRHMYFIASEHALRNGFGSKLLKFAFAPIPINKSKADVFAIKDMLNKLKEGANICLFAEGDRSFNGTTGPIPPSTAKLIKTSGADLITFRLEGGYFTNPRWAKKRRRGRMTGRYINKYSAAELKSMSNPEINALIERDIYEDAYERQKANLVRFTGKDLAENIETVLYLCPACEKIGTIRSEGNRFSCSCGLEAEYTETGLLSGDALPFSTMTEWDDWQRAKLEEIVGASGKETICSDEGQSLLFVHSARDSSLIGTGLMTISRDSLCCAGYAFPIDQIMRVVVAGQMLLLFALKDGTSYEVHSNSPRSALKYREIFRILTGASAQGTRD